MPTPMVERVYLHLGRAMRLARHRRGWNQETLAVYLGLTRASIANIETGRQRVLLHDVPEIARVLRVPVRSLLPPAWTK